MINHRHILTTIAASGSTGLSRLLVLWLVLACLTAHGIGVNLILGAFVRIGAEETTEESKGELELREATHKCARMKFVAPRRERIYSSVLGHADGVPHAPLPPQSLVPLHLIGAGIRVCC